MTVQSIGTFFDDSDEEIDYVGAGKAEDHESSYLQGSHCARFDVLVVENWVV